VITADHGNDPTTRSTDHSRERAPLLAYRSGAPGVNLGLRATFADLASTLAAQFGVTAPKHGAAFRVQ
ncbi:MAG: phosphopentomutase, partial [bacterium]